MTIQEFVEDKLKNRREYKLTLKDERTVSQNLEQFIVDRITSGKYRKSKIDDVTLANVTRKVHEAVTENKPVNFTFPFGGYKLFILPTAPTVDWAEFFTLAYYSDYLNQIAQYYEPGVVFTFSSDEVIVSKMNNIPQEDINAYTDSFRTLLKIFNEKNPKNLKLELQLVRDLYESEEELWSELESYYPETKDNWQSFDEAKKQSRKRMVFLNCKLDRKLSDSDIDKFMSENTMLHDAYMKLQKRKNFARGADKIVTFSFPISDSITLGTTKFSAAKFWTGYGAIKIEDTGRLCDVVLTPDQLEKVTLNANTVKLIDLPNFDKIDSFEASAAQ